MSVAHGCDNAMTQTRVTMFSTGGSGCNRPRVGVSAQPTVAASDDPAFNATALWRACNLAGYLERKVHRQWRSRGS